MHNIEKDIVFGEIKPSDVPTIANYISTIKNWIKLQNTHSCVFTISDLQVYNYNYKSQNIAEKSLDILSMIIATGLEGERNNLYIQSSVPQHAELAWLLYGFVINSKLTSEVDSLLGDNGKKNGYLDILNAADYLLYQANTIPIGYNKEKFIQLARLIATKFNETYGETFVLPNAFVDKYNSKIMGLQEVSKPMSRNNVSNKDNVIYLTDSVDEVVKKISIAKIEENEPFALNFKNPGIFNLLNIYRGISGKSEDEIVKIFSSLDSKKAKEAISTEINDKLKIIQMRNGILKKNPDYINTIIKANSSVSSYVATKTINKVKNAIGLYK